MNEGNTHSVKETQLSNLESGLIKTAGLEVLLSMLHCTATTCCQDMMQR